MSNLVEKLMKLSMEELEAIIKQKIKEAEENFPFHTERSEARELDKLKVEFEKAITRRVREIQSGEVTKGEIRRSRLISAIDEEARARLQAQKR
ncbi:hypothetical protein B7C51_24745 (plasmid) [Paenibacillus larvae subsp. pulvifaciens]|uniref:Uncharacterized protein n=1 Tax=Paenibacillus larvae subsp. pulvifaciens TaxID=1477 RepID=A0A1V0UZN3_9BACL|nr:hypothetical protein [Paenibacillus larvae]ARF70685.1 hypothetical protein B7C51_24745 [Paenibacillus larvae subsp. pulvifaciens]